MANDCRSVKELLRWLVTWRRLWPNKRPVQGVCCGERAWQHVGDPTLALSYLPLICSSKFQIFIADHFQVRGSRHAAKENRLTHSMRDHLCFGGWFTSWSRRKKKVDVSAILFVRMTQRQQKPTRTTRLRVPSFSRKLAPKPASTMHRWFLGQFLKNLKTEV